MANVSILHEVTNGIIGEEWSLCFQWCEFHYDEDNAEKGYRFIWRRPDGSLQPARGQARIPSAEDIFDLITRATAAGWFIKVE